mgnify:CR=1 FL=1
MQLRFAVERELQVVVDRCAVAGDVGECLRESEPVSCSFMPMPRERSRTFAFGEMPNSSSRAANVLASQFSNAGAMQATACFTLSSAGKGYVSERGFIKAETASYADYVELGGQLAAQCMRTFRTCAKKQLAGV